MPAALSAATPVSPTTAAAPPAPVSVGSGPSTTTGGTTAAGPSAWSRPLLVNPVTIRLSPTNYNLALPQNRDYILQCPNGALTMPHALAIWGGHNVVFENCNINITSPDWAAHFKNTAGTLWIHDVHFGGIALTGGVQLQEPGATVVMRDVLFDEVYGSYSTNHAELIQTWAGPARLLIDGLTGPTEYQGLFLMPNQFDSGPAPTVFDFRNIDIDDTAGAYALWLGDVTGSPSTQANAAIGTWNLQNVYVDPNPARTWPGWWLWPKPSTGDTTWLGVVAGVPPAGHYVSASATGATGVEETVAPAPLAGEGS